MKKYDSYKDSGVEWIGEIPQSWSITRIGVNSDLTVPQRDKPKDLTGPIPWLRIEDFGDKYVSASKSNQGVNQETIDAMNLKVYPVGTVLTACSCTMGMTAIVEKPLITNQTFIGITPKENLDAVYLYYFLKASTQYLNSISSGAIQSYLSRSEFSKLRIPKISIEEQTQIANYLDHKTTQIDHLIAKKEQFIQLLEEERVAVINQAVTKGLDPNVPMKDSGIEWLGEIPEHWEVKRIKHMLSEPLKYGANESAEEENLDDPRYIRITDFGNDGKLKANTFKSLPYSKAENFLLSEGDILFARSGATVGKTFFFNDYKGIACFAGYLIKASCDRQLMIPEFLYEFTNTGSYNNWKQSIFQQSTIQNIGADKYNQLKIAIPPISEQKAIVEFLKNKSNEIALIITKTEQEVELLKEYKTALISEVVTGKVDVRNEKLN